MTTANRRRVAVAGRVLFYSALLAYCLGMWALIFHVIGVL